MDAATAVLKDLGISKKKAIQDYALLNASQKLAEFTQECAAFRKKHKMAFKAFQRRIQSRDDEIFDEENDYLAWKFASDGAVFWREKVNRLKTELLAKEAEDRIDAYERAELPTITVKEIFEKVNGK